MLYSQVPWSFFLPHHACKHTACVQGTYRLKKTQPLLSHAKTEHTHYNCFKPQHSVRRALSFPAELIELDLRKVSIGRLVLCRVTCGWVGLLAIWWQLRSMRYKWFHIINHCLLPRLSSPPPTGFPFSSLSSSLQPPASLLRWQLFLMLTKPPLDGILPFDCGFLSPANHTFIPLPPLLHYFDCNQGQLSFTLSDGVKRGGELLGP